MARKLSPGTHNIRIKKPGGGTRMQRVQVLKSGKFKFIKNVKGAARAKPKARTKPGGKARRTSPKKQGGTPRMANRKMSFGNRLINMGLLALAFLPVLQQIPNLIANPKNAVGFLISRYSAGFIAPGPGKFVPAFAAEAYGPVGLAFILFEIKKHAKRKFRF